MVKFLQFLFHLSFLSFLVFPVQSRNLSRRAERSSGEQLVEERSTKHGTTSRDAVLRRPGVQRRGKLVRLVEQVSQLRDRGRGLAGGLLNAGHVLRRGERLVSTLRSRAQ